MELQRIFKSAWLDSPLGPMFGVADEEFLYLLEFIDRRGLEQAIAHFKITTNSEITPGESNPIHSIKEELKQYFEGTLQHFNTPISVFGTPFQKSVWKNLQKIPFGRSCSYIDLATSTGQPSACRAVAQANGANRLALIIPCHRVINANGNLGGYAGGLNRKQWLLAHEKSNCS